MGGGHPTVLQILYWEFHPTRKAKRKGKKHGGWHPKQEEEYAERHRRLMYLRAAGADQPVSDGTVRQ